MPIRKTIELEYHNTFTQDADGAWPLNHYQFNQIPENTRQWFKSQYGQAILAYTANNPIPVYIKVTKLTRDAHLKHLLSCQAAGVGFITLKEYRLFADLHPVCRRCIRKMDCLSKGRGLAKYATNNDQFACYSSPDRIDIAAELLKPLQNFRLQ